MSYSILYRSMFVKLSDGRFIPMMEMGDNNVWDCNYGRGRDRRSRSWSNINLVERKKIYTHEDLVKGLDAWLKESEMKRERDRNSDVEWKKEQAINGSFGYYEAISVYGKHTTNTTFNHVKNIILSGEKNCITFDFAVSKLGLRIGYWENSEYMTKSFNTEEEMMDIINSFIENKKSYYFVFSNKYLVNDVYNRSMAKKGFMKHNGKREAFILCCTDKEDKTIKKYVSVLNNDFQLVDSIEEAFWFNKYDCNGYGLSEFMFDTFSNISSIRFLYKKELKEIA